MELQEATTAPPPQCVFFEKLRMIAVLTDVSNNIENDSNDIGLSPSKYICDFGGRRLIATQEISENLHASPKYPQASTECVSGTHFDYSKNNTLSYCNRSQQRMIAKGRSSKRLIQISGRAVQGVHIGNETNSEWEHEVKALQYKSLSL